MRAPKRKGDEVFEDKVHDGGGNSGGGNTTATIVFCAGNNNDENQDPILSNVLRRLQTMKTKFCHGAVDDDDDDPTTAANHHNHHHYYQDPILKAIETMNEKDKEPEQQLTDKANQVLEQLREQIAEAKQACQQESHVLHVLSEELSTLQGKRNSLLEHMDQLDSQHIELQRRIALHQEEASQEIESMDFVQEERKRQVPRLKTQISLYASTTGIKWDFHNEDILSGQVVCIKN